MARGTHRDWLVSGETIGIVDAPSHVGKVSYSLTYDAENRQIIGNIELVADSSAEWLILHIRLPESHKATNIHSSTGLTLHSEGTEIMWDRPSGQTKFTINVDSI
ncbi:hypothetical protein [Cohnella soli]|uniref:Uncharacterized protein n=1 Tax=Cohnella soli TaxID=425005 RepID=A0ABW0I087_9BACL